MQMPHQKHGKLSNHQKSQSRKLRAELEKKEKEN